MGKSSGFPEKKNTKFKVYFIDNFSWFAQNKVGKCIKSIHICQLWVLTGFSAKSEKNQWLGHFLNLKLNTRLPAKKDTKIRR